MVTYSLHNELNAQLASPGYGVSAGHIICFVAGTASEVSLMVIDLFLLPSFVLLLLQKLNYRIDHQVGQ